MKREVSFFSLVSMLQKGKLNNNNNKKGPKNSTTFGKISIFNTDPEFQAQTCPFCKYIKFLRHSFNSQ